MLKWKSIVLGPAVLVPVLVFTLFGTVGCANGTAGGGRVVVGAQATVSTATPKQPRVELWIDVSNSTRRHALRMLYLARAVQIVDGAIEDSAYLRIVVFTGAASNASPILEASMQATGPNSSYVEATKRKLRSTARQAIARALFAHTSSREVIRGSDPAGAILYGVRSAKSGVAPGTAATVWVLTDGEQTFRRTNLSRLMRVRGHRRIVDRWLRPYVPDARGVDVHLRGLAQSYLATASTLLSIRVEDAWRRFCAKSKARSCDVRTEV